MNDSNNVAPVSTLISQREARTLSRERNAAGDYPPGMVNIAHAVPINSWGGREKGWTVSLVPLPS